MENEYTVLAGNLRAIADAIRQKAGGTTTITPEQMSTQIAALPRLLEITQAEYDALTNYDENTYYCVSGG